MEIIEIVPPFASVLSELHRKSFGQNFWNTHSLHSILRMPRTFGGVAVDNSHPLGFIMGQEIASEVEIFTLCVEPSQRRKSVGSYLLSWFIAQGKRKGGTRFFLEVSERNAPAIALYKKFNFQYHKKRPHYYADGQDALLFCRELADGVKNPDG